MTLNCKQGDLAVVVGGTRGRNVGKVVRCLELLPREAHMVKDEWGPVWRIDRELEFANCLGTALHKMAPDKCLMPISPGDAVREEELTAVTR